YHRFGGDQKTGNRCRTLDRRAHDFGRVDNAFGDEIAVFAGLRVEAVGILILVHDLADHDRTVRAGIDRDLARRRLDRLTHDLHAVLLVLVFGLDALECIDRTQQGNAPARQDAFLDRGASCVHRVIDAILALLHLDLGGTADADHRNAASELRQPLLQLLLVIVGRGLLDLGFDLGNSGLDLGLLAGAVHDSGVLLIDHHFLGAAKHVDRDVLKLDAEIFRDRLAAGQDRDVLQHGLAAIAKTRRFHCGHFESAAQLVDHQGRKCFALDILGYDDEGLGGLHYRLQQRQELLEARQLLLVDEQVGILHFDPHLVGIGDEVGGDIAAIELHTLDHVEFGLERLCFLDRNHALVADLLHGIGEELADFGIAIGRYSANLRDFFVRRDLLRVFLQILDDGVDGEINATLQVHRVHAGGDRLGAFPDNRVGEYGCGGGAIAGLVRGPRRDFTHHLRTHVLELVFELDLLGDGNAVLGDAGCAERLVEHDVAALGAERHAHRIGEDVHAAQHPVARVD